MSRSRSCITRFGRREPKMFLPNTESLLHRGTKDAADRASQLLPLVRLDVELLAAPGGQTVELCAAIVLRGAVLERNPAALDEPVQRGVQRPLLHPQQMIGAGLDGLGQRMAVRRSELKRPEDQQVERALQQLDALAILS